MSNVFWSPVRCLTASDKDPSTALGMTFVESRSLPFVFIPPWEDSSCAFGAPLLQGPTHGAESLSFPFIPPWGDPSCAFGAALLQGPTHRADSLSFPFILPRGSILHLRRGPSPRTYSWSGVLSFPFIPLRGIHPAPLAQSFSKGLLMEQIHSLFLLYRFEESSCAFGAPLLQGAT